MNLVDQLLKADVKKADELETGVYKSKRLAKILGLKENTVDVEIKEVKSRRANDIFGYMYDKNGKMNYEKLFDAKLMMCIEGVTNPNLRDKDLQEHFECKTAKDLCEKLFGSEVTEISDAISLLSGAVPDSEDDEEKEIKNL